ncbi:MAG: hypothetical protein M9894_04670 [Planctomycetes bacterium]|nr:hypothetical protein [Planctomycetota bacterium]
MPLALALGDLLARLALRALGQAPRPRPRRPGGWRARAVAVVALAAWSAAFAAREQPWAVVAARAQAPLASPAGLRARAAALVGSRRVVAPPWAAWPHAGTGIYHRALYRHPEARLREAVRLDRLAAARGHVPSMLALDAALGGDVTAGFSGFRAPPTYDERRECVAWLRRAADADDVEAMRRLGGRLLDGWEDRSHWRPGSNLLLTVEPDEREALAREGLGWLRTAAERGADEAAQDLFGHLRRRRDLHEAAAWGRRLGPRRAEIRDDLHELLLERPDLRRASDDTFLDALEDDRSLSTAGLQALRPVLRFAGDLPPELDAAVRLLELRQAAPARALAERALAQDPTDVVANNVMAALYLGEGLARPALTHARVQVAAAYLRRAERAWPGDPSTDVNLAACEVLLLLRGGHHTGRWAYSALRRLHLATSLADDPVLRTSRAAVERMLAERGVTWAVHLDDARGWHSHRLLRAADRRRAAGEDALALQGYTEALLHGPANDEARASRAWLRASCGALEEALDDCSQALALDPRRDVTLGLRGRLRVLLGDRAGGLDDLARAAGLERGEPWAALWLAWLTGDARRLRVAPARGWVGVLVRHGRGEVDDRGLLAAALAAPGKDPQVSRLCVVHCVLGLAAERAGDLDAARARYATSVAFGQRRWAQHAWAAARLAQLDLDGRR